MGSTASTQISAALSVTSKNKKMIDKDGMVDLLMPIYYTSSPLLPHEREQAIKAWKLVANGLAPEFHRLKKQNADVVHETSPPEFFGNQLVKRFIAVHPVSQHMFSNTTTKQGTLFFRMISFLMSSLEDEERFESHFVMLARTHNRMGVRAVEYGVFCEVLFYVLRLTLGDDYNATAHIGWVKIFSRILRIVIPVVVDYELENKPTISEITTRRISKMTSMINVAKAGEDEKSTTLLNAAALSD